MKIMQTVDVIIPVYRPGQELLSLLEQLQSQTLQPDRIILYNTEEKLFLDFAQKQNLTERFPNVSVFHHTKQEFDHGMTRNRGVSKSQAEIFVMMTMDAVPADSFLLERLVAALLQEEKIAVAYARQLPNETCREIEKYTRSFNYPEVSRIKTAKDEAELGIKTYFCSNVCAAYKRDVFDALGGFIKHTIFNEDMIYAGRAVKQGYAICYAADAKVIHSHNYTNGQQFHRNFDLGVSQTDHPEVFAGLASESEGIKLVLNTQKHLIRTHHMGEIFRLYTSSAAKLLGYKLGRNYQKLPKWLIYRCTMNREYWDMQ